MFLGKIGWSDLIFLASLLVIFVIGIEYFVLNFKIIDFFVVLKKENVRATNVFITYWCYKWLLVSKKCDVSGGFRYELIRIC